jgi:putative Mg2+ transporter-C (MgtC) family protein
MPMSPTRLSGRPKTDLSKGKVTGNIGFLSRRVLAALPGSVIGFKRERLNWAAGLRTPMLACADRSLAMLVSAAGFGDVLGEENVVLDPFRIAARMDRVSP